MSCPKCVVHWCNGFMSNLDQLQSTFSRVALIPWVELSIFVFQCNFMANKLDLLGKCAQTISATIFCFISYYWLVAILLTHGFFLTMIYQCIAKDSYIEGFQFSISGYRSIHDLAQYNRTGNTTD